MIASCSVCFLHLIAFSVLGLVPKPPVDQIVALRAQAESGDSASQLKLGFAYDAGHGVMKDAVEAAKWFRKAAEQGDALAQINIAFMLDQGRGVPKDVVAATAMFRKAAIQGQPIAQDALGLRYDQGLGVAPDPVESCAWYELSLSSGFEPSKSPHAGLLARLSKPQLAAVEERVRQLRKEMSDDNPGLSVREDVRKMREETLSRATGDTERGLLRASWAVEDAAALGQACFRGDNGREKDFALARKWLTKAAEGDDPLSIQLLAQLCFNGGQGVKPDLPAAEKWFRKAALMGDSPAAFTVGLMKDEGQGVARDPVEAMSFYQLSLSLGDDMGAAQKHAKALEAKLTPAQVLQARSQTTEMLRQVERRKDELHERRVAVMKAANPKVPIEELRQQVLR